MGLSVGISYDTHALVLYLHIFQYFISVKGAISLKKLLSKQSDYIQIIYFLGY